jgi:hypothetical protein
VENKEKTRGIGKRFFGEILSSPLSFGPEYIGFGLHILRNNLSCNLYDIPKLCLFTLPPEIFPVTKPVRNKKECGLGDFHTRVYPNGRYEPTARLMLETWGMVESEKKFSPEGVVRLYVCSGISMLEDPSEKYPPCSPLTPNGPHAGLFPPALVDLALQHMGQAEITNYQLQDKGFDINVNFYADGTTGELLVCFVPKNLRETTFLEAIDILKGGFPEGLRFASRIAEVVRDHLNQLPPGPNGPEWTPRLIGAGLMGSLASFAGARNHVPFTVFNPIRIPDIYLPEDMKSVAAKSGDVFLIEGCLGDPRHPERSKAEKRCLCYFTEAGFLGQVYIVPKEYRTGNDPRIVEQPDRYFKKLLKRIIQNCREIADNPVQGLPFLPNANQPFMDLIIQCSAKKPNLNAVIRILKLDPTLINTRDPESRETPLMVQVKNESFHPELTRILLDCGADVRLRDKNGKTAIDVACSHRSPNQETVLLLLKYGANPKAALASISDENDRTWLYDLKSFSQTMSNDFLTVWIRPRFCDVIVSIGGQPFGVSRKLFLQRTGIDPSSPDNPLEDFDPDLAHCFMIWVYSGYCPLAKEVQADCRKIGVDFAAHDGLHGFRQDMVALYRKPDETKDFSILTRDQDVLRVDRFVLAARSKYFFHALSDAPNTVTGIKDPLKLSTNSWNILLRWMYTNEMDYSALMSSPEDRIELNQVQEILKMNRHEYNPANPHSFQNSIQRTSGTNWADIADCFLLNNSQSSEKKPERENGNR